MRAYAANGANGLAALALMGAMAGGRVEVKRRNRTYSDFVGPPHPKSRQHLRALKRASEKALAAIQSQETTP